nr:MAG TPA: Protein damX division, peptidoglycan binding domain [Caudoviricetes sp.]
MYEVYDKTDPAHCIFIGLFDTLEEATKAAKRHKESFPNAEIWAYEMIRED